MELNTKKSMSRSSSNSGLWKFVLFSAVTGLLPLCNGQDYFMNEIKCYSCVGPYEGNNCTDNFPVKPEDAKALIDIIPCKEGACMKWKYYENDTWMLERTCTNEKDFMLPLVHGACYPERRSSHRGWLCLCGKDYCNGSMLTHNPHPGTIIVAILMGLVLRYLSVFTVIDLSLNCWFS